jgi:transposase
MKAYSVDLRKRVVEAVESGAPRAEVAGTFGVGLATLKRWVARRRRDPEDDLLPRTPPGQSPSIAPEQCAELWAQLEGHRTATVAEHAGLWNEAHSTNLSQWTLGRAIRRLGWTRKKGVWEPPSATRKPGPSIGGE